MRGGLGLHHLDILINLDPQFFVFMPLLPFAAACCLPPSLRRRMRERIVDDHEAWKMHGSEFGRAFS